MNKWTIGIGTALTALVVGVIMAIDDMLSPAVVRNIVVGFLFMLGSLIAGWSVTEARKRFLKKPWAPAPGQTDAERALAEENQDKIYLTAYVSAGGINFAIGSIYYVAGMVFDTGVAVQELAVYIPVVLAAWAIASLITAAACPWMWELVFKVFGPALIRRGKLLIEGFTVKQGPDGRFGVKPPPTPEEPDPKTIYQDPTTPGGPT